MKYFEKAPKAITDRIRMVLKDHQDELHAAKVKVGAMLVRADPLGDDNEAIFQCLTHQGMPAAATISVLGARDRARGGPDAEILIDDFVWNHLDDQQQTALIDHELQHLELALDKHGEVKRDAQDRPKMSTRPHDFQVGGFHAVIKRHGEAALEAMGLTKVLQDTYQLLFAFALQGDDHATVNLPLPAKPTPQEQTDAA